MSARILTVLIDQTRPTSDAWVHGKTELYGKDNQRVENIVWTVIIVSTLSR